MRICNLTTPYLRGIVCRRAVRRHAPSSSGPWRPTTTRSASASTTSTCVSDVTASMIMSFDLNEDN